MSLPSPAEVEHADWTSLQRMCGALGLNPKGRSAIVRMRVLDHVRRRTLAPSWRPNREHQAALLTRLGSPDLAERVWESTIQLDAAAPWVGLGHAQLAGGFLSEAAKSFARAAGMGDPSAELHRAEALAAGGDFDGAARSVDAYLTSHPRDLRGLLMKASLLSRAGFDEESTKVLHTALDLHLEVRGLRRTLSRALLKAGHHAAAADALHEAVREDPKDLEARVDRGAALLLTGRTREAIGVLREALEIDPRRADVLNNLGVAYAATGHSRSAIVNLERAAKHLESPRILLNLGKVQEAMTEGTDARHAYEQVLRLRPKDPEAVAGRKRTRPPTAAGQTPKKRAAKSKAKDGPVKKRRTKSSAPKKSKSEAGQES